MKKAMLAESIGLIDVSVIEDFLKTDAQYGAQLAKRKRKTRLSVLLSAACLVLVMSVLLASLPLYALVMPESFGQSVQEHLMPEDIEDSIVGDWTKWDVTARIFEMLRMGQEDSFANTLKQSDRGLLSESLVQAGCLLDELYEYYLKHVSDDHDKAEQETKTEKEYPIPIPEVSMGLSFETTSTGNYRVTGYALGADGVVCIPAEHNGKRVVEIRKDIFRYDKHVKEVYILGGVGAIQSDMFDGCESLELVYMGDSVSVIRDWAFEGCTNLRKVYLSDKLTEIEMCAFKGCTSLQSITIPDTTKIIGINAFEGCTSLQSVDMPKNLKSLGDRAFYGCSALTEIEIPSGIETTGEYTFFKCTSLQKVVFGDGLKTVGGYAFQSCFALHTLELPDSVTEIGDYAFEGCALTELTLPESLQEIKKSAFLNCKQLSKVTFSDNLVNIGSNAFKYTSVREYDYTGTVEQWKQISKAYIWYNDPFTYTVHCSDGDYQPK